MTNILNNLVVFGNFEKVCFKFVLKEVQVFARRFRSREFHGTGAGFGEAHSCSYAQQVDVGQRSAGSQPEHKVHVSCSDRYMHQCTFVHSLECYVELALRTP